MSLNHQIYKRLVGGLVGLTTLVIVFWHRADARVSLSKGGQVESRDFGSRMIEFIKQGRYDDAVEVGLRALQNGPNDEIVYQQIANVYLIRAQKEDPSQREQWVTKGVSYIEKALSLNSKERDVAGVHLLLDAQDFEVAGDLSATGRCAYYERATKLLEDRVPLLQGDKLTLEGKAYPLAPLRKENDRTLAEVKGKSANAKCK